jgi:hypothetical protein
VGIGSVSQPNSSFSVEVKDGEFSPVGRWKTSLSPAQLERLEILLGGTLRELGYALQRSTDQSSVDQSSLRTSSSPSRRGSLRRMRLVYETYFDAKLLLKKRAPFSKMLVSADLPRF